MRRFSFLIPAILLLAGGCAPLRELLRASPASLEDALAAQVTIVRDERGVAHVYGPTDASVAFGAAYAQAEDDYAQIEEGTIHALGRASYLYGDAFLANDLLRVALDVERRARAEYAAEPAARREVWDAFAAGLNYFMRTSGVPRRLIGRWEPWMLFARFHDPDPSMEFVLSYDSAAREMRVLSGMEKSPESIAWAIAPSRSATGAALLLASMYGRFDGPTRPYEIHVESGAGWNWRGAVLLGTPVPYAAFGERTAWARTRRPRATLETLAAVGPVTERIDTLRVNSPRGVETRVLRWRATAAGSESVPVVGAHAGEIVVVGGVASGELPRLYALSRAGNADEVVAAGARDVVYADADGRIVQFRDGSAVAADAGWVAAGGTHATPAQDTSWTLSALVAAAFDARVEGADSAIDALVLEWEQLGGTNPQRAMRMDLALDTLRAWDRKPSVTSTAARLFVRWRTRLRSGAYTGEFPRFRALEDVVVSYAARLEPWGRAHVLRRGAGDSLVVRAESQQLGGMARYDRLPATDGSAIAIGNAWLIVVQPGDPASAQTVSANGQAGDAASPHWFDQAAFYARGELLSAWFRRENVAAHTLRSYSPGSGSAVR